MLTFLRLRSLDPSHDVDATLTWGGVGWGGGMRTFTRLCTKTLRLHQWGGVGWGDDNAQPTLRKTLMLRPR